jgi:hypothetical protein
VLRALVRGGGVGEDTRPANILCDEGEMGGRSSDEDEDSEDRDEVDEHDGDGEEGRMTRGRQPNFAIWHLYPCFSNHSTPMLDFMRKGAASYAPGER